MLAYILRRILYAIPILIGINLLTFSLFFVVNSPDDIAMAHLGHKHVNSETILAWKKARGYDKALLVSAQDTGLKKITNTLFFEKSVKLFAFEFGFSDAGRDISQDIKQRMWPSLAIAIPSLFIGLLVHISVALLMVFFRGTYLDLTGGIICVAMMSISMLFYIIGAQYLIAKTLKLVPISGYIENWGFLKFLILPVFIGVIGGFGAGVRWYRALFLEEVNKEYVRTARSKGASEFCVLFKHILPNTMIVILTGVVVLLPLLFLGSLLTESFFGIPGLGSYTIEAINQQDFSIVRAMVFLGSVLYILGLILTDISYTWADPRVRLN